MRKNLQAEKLTGALLKLSPLLGLYLLCGVLFARQNLRGDESRYIIYANNLLHGHFATPESLMFWNGPGYPLFLAPFIWFKLPILVPRLANAFLLFFSIVYFYATLKRLGISNRAFLYAYGMGLLLFLHGPLIEMLMSESLSVFLVSAGAYHYFSLVRVQEHRWGQMVAAASYLAALALTKVFFGFVMELSLVVALAFWACKKALTLYKAAETTQDGKAVFPSASGSAIQVCTLALAICFPYLLHTFAVTGKFNYWGNSGGLQLYCLTVPEPELLGDWLNFDLVRDNAEFFPEQSVFFQKMARLDYIARDDAFKHAAMENLKSRPGKFFWNWRANVNRMVFGFPVTPYPGSDSELTTGNRTFIYGLPFLLLLIAFIPGWIGRQAIPAEVHVVLLFAVLSLGGLSLLSCIPRQVFPVLPLLGLWTVLAAERTFVWKWKADSL